MEFELKILNLKKFLIVVLLSIPITFVLLIFVSLKLGTPWPVYLLLPIIVINFIYAQKSSNRVSQIRVASDYLIINTNCISFVNIQGYFIEENVTMTSLYLKLTSNEILRYTFSTSGLYSKNCKEFLNVFINEIKDCNSEVIELTYKQAHRRQTGFILPFFIFSLVLVLILDFYSIIRYINEGIIINWYIYLLNIYVLSLVAFLKKKNN